MGKLFDMADELSLELNELVCIANTLRYALQHQADFVSAEAQHLLVVTEILCTKMECFFDKYDKFLYKIPQDL